MSASLVGSEMCIRDRATIRSLSRLAKIVGLEARPAVPAAPERPRTLVPKLPRRARAPCTLSRADSRKSAGPQECWVRRSAGC
eukprot:5171286-Alexandrium_andersonii.AAC.1